MPEAVRHARKGIGHSPVFSGLCAGVAGPETVIVVSTPEDERDFWLGYTWAGAIRGLLLLGIVIAVSGIEAGHRPIANATPAIPIKRSR